MNHRYLMCAFILASTAFSQLTPKASTIIDAYMPFGAHNMNSFALFPVIPNQGYTQEAPSASFHLSGDVDLYSPGIAALTATGMEYYMFFQWADLETTSGAEVVADDPDIDDPLFGVQILLDGTPNQVSTDKYLRSMNRVAWRNFFLKSVKRGIEAGADGVILDGAASLHFDSFDPEDLAAFLTYMLTRYDTTTLNDAGWNFQTTDYRVWIHDELGYTDFPQSLDIQSDAPPFAREWLDFKLERNRQTWEIIQDSINAFGNAAGRVITLYGNCAYLGEWNQSSIYHMLNLVGRDLPYYKGQLASEYFHFGDRYPLTGSITGLVKNAGSLGVRNVIWSSPNPEGTNQQAFEQQQYLTAEAFAAGGLAEFGAGPGDLDVYLPAFYMIQTQRDLLDAVRPHAQAAVILPMASGIREYFLPREFGAQMLLQEIGLTYNVVSAGNNIDWPDEFTLDQIDGYPLLVLPEAPYLTQNQINVLLTYISGGGNLITFGFSNYPGYAGGLDENNQPLSNPDWETLVQGSTGIRNYGSGHVYLLSLQSGAVGTNLDHYWNRRNSTDPGEVAVADAIRNSVANALPALGIIPEIRRRNMDRKIMVFRHDTPTEDAMLIHFVSGNVDAGTLLHTTEENLTVNLSLPVNLTGDSASVTFYSPENPTGSEMINVPIMGDSISLTVPALFIWDMAYVQEQVSPPLVAVDHLTVTNATDGYRLKSDQIPEFAWNPASGSQASYQLQIWANALYVGDPLYDTGQMMDGTSMFQPQDWQPETGRTYMARVRIGDNAGNQSAWTVTGFHSNLPPEAPSQPSIYDRIIDAYYSGIFAGAIVDTFPIFKFAPANDGEVDSLRYLVEIWTDSLTDNITDSTNLYFLYAQMSDEIYPIVGIGDFVFDTLTTELDIDNYGIWWRVRSFDGLDTSDASTWGRFTWDHRNDPPNPFDLVSPVDQELTGLNVTFRWNFEGDSDPSSQWLSNADLYLAEDEDFTVNPEILENVGLEVNQNPHIDYPGNLPNHKQLFWKILIHDQNGGSRFSNQVWSIFADDGSNGAPGYPDIIPGPTLMSLNDALEWNSPTDPENDVLYYELQIAESADFSTILITRDEITGGERIMQRPKLKTVSHSISARKGVPRANENPGNTVPGIFHRRTLSGIVSPGNAVDRRNVVSFFLSNLGDDTALLSHGTTYYWRVRAYDHFGGDSGFSGTVAEFSLNETPVADMPDALTINEDESGEIITDLFTIFSDPDNDVLNIAVDSVSTGIDSARSIIDQNTPALEVYLTENHFGDSAWVALSATDPYGATAAGILYINILPVNDAPGDFALVAPAADSLIVFTNDNLSTTLTFIWESSVDVDEDPLSYRLTYSASDTILIDTVLTETQLVVAYNDLNNRLMNLAVTRFHGQWTVTAGDSSLETMALNGPFALTLNSEVTMGIEPEIPHEFALRQNYPNPFNPVTTLEYALPRETAVVLQIYDIRGQVVKTLVNRSQPAGYQAIIWDGTDDAGRPVSSGMYIYRITAGSFTDTKKLMLLK
ncbi:MAG: T9SS type A sorting domain-containing protein [FCB group bacterium]|nr:T9SS type A sorting domain-containing protein [FCB group bacterium]